MNRTVFVPGVPRPQGSKAYKGHRGGKPILVESSKALGGWRRDIASAALSGGGILPPGPIRAEVLFVMPRPAQTPKRRPTPAAVKRPDLDKLIRAVFDALTGIWIHDDSQIVRCVMDKRIAEPDEQSGVHIQLETIPAAWCFVCQTDCPPPDVCGPHCQPTQPQEKP